MSQILSLHSCEIQVNPSTDAAAVIIFLDIQTALKSVRAEAFQNANPRSRESSVNKVWPLVMNIFTVVY